MQRLPKKWAPSTNAGRYEPFVPLEQRIQRVRRRFAAGEHYQRRLVVFDRACAALDRKRIAALQHKYRAYEAAGFNAAGALKYLDTVFWIWHKTDLFCRLDLDRLPPQSVLDIGMGGGHFSFICQAYGHRAAGVDVSRPVYERICTALGVERLTHRVTLAEPLPAGMGRFDIITGIWVMFNCSVQPDGFRSYWRNGDWAKFLQAIHGHLYEQGRFYLELNQHKADGGLVWDDAFVNACEQTGTDVCREQGRRLTLDRTAIDRFVAADWRLLAAE